MGEQRRRTWQNKEIVLKRVVEATEGKAEVKKKKK